MLFDEILAKGFDGQNFIGGLASHFRNLLMAQNSRTVALMEVADTIKKKYIDQAQNADKQLLLRALEMTSECDFNYKASNNKRLLVEICLMKINANYVWVKQKKGAQVAFARQSREC